ncbi:MAG TPA: AfsR/SARP family transcriptional regulator, partial [Phytomonospora sp.]
LLAETHRTVLRGTPVAAPARRDHNLPASITSFIGRDDDLAAIGAMLGPSRLVTLTGPGGAGKTRLAIGAAARADGDVRLVELAPVADPAEVPHAMLTALDLHDTVLTSRRAVKNSPGDPVDRMIGALRRTPTLLVLDNCEHLVDAAASVAARLLAGCPDLRVLATSREPLGLTGETLYPVAPLPYPAPGVTVAEALAFPAVRLLADRGRAARPDFAVTDANLAAVLDIVRRLDGLPLAVELASARLRSMTPAEIAARLGERFRLLTGGDRAALPRHRTLRAVVDWSWELLGPAERELLTRMSVLAGGADLAAVEALTDGDPLDALTSLVDKSLVVHGADGRYRLLETIREYGAERLAADPEADRDVHRRHCLHYLARAEADDPLLRTGAQLEALHRLTADYDNHAAAQRWAVREKDASIAVRFVAALGWYWWLRSRRAEGSQAALAALSLDGPVDPLSAALANIVCAFNSFEAGPGFGSVFGFVHRALELRAEYDLRDASPLMRMLDLLDAILHQRDTEAVVQTAHLLDDADPWVRATAYSFHGALRVNIGDFEGSAEHLEISGRLFEEIGDRWGLSFVLAELGEISMWRGDLAAADDVFRRALAAEDEIGADPGMSQMRIRYAACRALIDPPETATARLSEVLADARAVREHNNIAHAAVALAAHLRRVGDLDGAAEALDEVAGELPFCGGPPHMDALHAASLAYLRL